MGCDLWWWALCHLWMFLSVALYVCLFSYCTRFSWRHNSTFWVKYRSLRGCCSWPFEWWGLHSLCCIPAVQCHGAQPPSLSAWERGGLWGGLRVWPLHPAPGSKKLPELGDIPGDSQLFKRGLGSVRKWAIFSNCELNPAPGKRKGLRRLKLEQSRPPNTVHSCVSQHWQRRFFFPAF